MSPLPVYGSTSVDTSSAGTPLWKPTDDTTSLPPTPQYSTDSAFPFDSGFKYIPTNQLSGSALLEPRSISSQYHDGASWASENPLATVAIALGSLTVVSCVGAVARGRSADLCHHASNAAKIGGSAIKAGAERTARTVSDLCSNKISPSRQWYGGSRTIGSEGTDGHELESGVHSSRMPASHPASTNEKSSAPEESLPSRLERNPAGRISVRSLTSSPLPS